MKKKVSIIGGGASALLLAAFLDSNLFEVVIFERNKSLGRKFLVAGKGGFNLTHSETIELFWQRYTPDFFFKKTLLKFDNVQLRKWLETIGIPTFIGSSKRVYPEKGIKPIEVLNAIKAVLEAKGVQFQFQKKWTGWNEKMDLVFDSSDSYKSDYCVFALGGGSWKVTGSNSDWLDVFSKRGISTQAFQASNCAFKIDWPDGFLLKNGGKPLKNIAITCSVKTQKGEVVITSFGLEGNAIYALSPQIQEELNTQQQSTIYIDLKPTLTLAKIKDRIAFSKEKTTTQTLRKGLNLSQCKSIS